MLLISWLAVEPLPGLKRLALLPAWIRWRRLFRQRGGLTGFFTVALPGRLWIESFPLRRLRQERQGRLS
jgi:hypothetical protein